MASVDKLDREKAVFSFTINFLHIGKEQMSKNILRLKFGNQQLEAINEHKKVSNRIITGSHLNCDDNYFNNDKETGRFTFASYNLLHFLRHIIVKSALETENIKPSIIPDIAKQ